MAGGFVPFGQNLQLQSGVPLQKVASVFLENLTATKRMEGGTGSGMSGLLRSVIRDGNLSSIMQNPMAALTGAVQGQIGGLVGQLQGMAGGGPQGLIQALTGSAGAGGLLSGGLSQAMSLFQGAGDNLAGLTNGARGFFAMMGHANTVDMAGSELPAAAAMSQVTAPLTSGAFLREVADRLPGVVVSVVAGSMTPEAATTWVQQQSAWADAIRFGSAAALAWGEEMHPAIATVSTVAGALMPPVVFGEAGAPMLGEASGFQGVLSTLVQDGPRAAMNEAAAEMIRHIEHAAVDVAAITSLEG